MYCIPAHTSSTQLPIVIKIKSQILTMCIRTHINWLWPAFSPHLLPFLPLIISSYTNLSPTISNIINSSLSGPYIALPSVWKALTIWVKNNVSPTSDSITLLSFIIFTPLWELTRLCVYCLSPPIRMLGPWDYLICCCIPSDSISICTKQMLS